MQIRATYRLQFTPQFTFSDATQLAPYLARLGVSHVYASPYLKARPGSTHGYDIVDHNAFNPELGGVGDFRSMVSTFRRHGIEQILDFVPNHMGVGGADNPFWLDVLEWGPDSDYAGWFDVNWTPDRRYLHDKVLVPFLGRQYGAELNDGRLSLKYDREAGSFAVWAYDTHKLPISPFDYGLILGTVDPELERLGDSFAHLGEWRPQIARRAEALKTELASLVRGEANVSIALARAMARFAGQAGEPGTWAGLDDLIGRQHWRPAYFRVAADDINYRRFFNIAELAGIRMELPSVFDHAHRLVFDLLKDGTIQGLRIDHIDGLLDPKGYLARLRDKARTEDEQPFYLVVEKILGEGEPLRTDWPIDGTTGYEFTNLILNLLIDPAGEPGFSALYAEIAEDGRPFERLLRECKKLIMDNEMASELAGLAGDASRVALQTNQTADFTLNILRRALREIIACFPVYRTYVDDSGSATEDDRHCIDEAIAAARPNEAAIDESVYEFLRRLMTGDLVAHQNSGFSRSDVLRCAMRLQQYSGPVMAKGLEDTAFYRYNRFVALNEVGGHPQDFGRSLASFHAANRQRAELWPRSMLGTSTHDTKRGEDARARLAVLSEIPEQWSEQVRSWMRLLVDERGGAIGPDRNDVYALLQTLVGTWPIELMGDSLPAEALESYKTRLKEAVTKSLREAKVHSTWAAPDSAYEGAVTGLVDAALQGEKAQSFLSGFLPFARQIARTGVHNSLVQTALKLTLPGVPDIYQGADLWDLSMVDPDNRRPVDYGLRASLLDQIEHDLEENRAGAMARYLDRWQDGRIKLAVVRSLLALRQQQAALFAQGTYEPLEASGPASDAVCAFVRTLGDRSAIIAAARFPARRERTPLDSRSELPLPAASASSEVRDVLTGKRFRRGRPIPASELFASLPVAVLVSVEP